MKRNEKDAKTRSDKTNVMVRKINAHVSLHFFHLTFEFWPITLLTYFAKAL